MIWSRLIQEQVLTTRAKWNHFESRLPETGRRPAYVPSISAQKGALLDSTPLFEKLSCHERIFVRIAQSSFHKPLLFGEFESFQVLSHRIFFTRFLAQNGSRSPRHNDSLHSALVLKLKRLSEPIR